MNLAQVRTIGCFIFLFSYAAQSVAFELPNDRIALVTGSWMVLSYVASMITEGVVFQQSENSQSETWETRKLAAASWGTQLGSLSVGVGLGLVNCDFASGVVLLGGTCAAYALSSIANLMILTNWEKAKAFSEGLVRASIANTVSTVVGSFGTILGFLISWRLRRQIQMEPAS